MESRYSSSPLGLVAVLALFVSLIPVTGAQFVQSYCSSQNTGENDVYTWPYQSNGNCTNHCSQEGTYAFAVLQWTDCWCSNYVPGTTDDISDCQRDCPGFPSEKCGDKDKDLFMYIKMDGRPSGTRGGSKPTAPAAAPSSEEPSEAPTAVPPQVVTSIVKPAPDVIISLQTKTVYPSLSSTPPPSSSSSSSTTSEKPEQSSTRKTSPSSKPANKPESTTTEEPRTKSTVVTESGVIITRTVVYTPSAVPVAESAQKESSNVGAIAGGVVGGVAGLIAIVGGILFVLWRRRKQQAHQEGGQDGSAGISRNVSTMSRAGLLGGRNEKNPPPLVTTFGSQRSRTDEESVTPVTPSTRRLSQPILVDSRLNPNAVLTFHGANQSRESFGSIDDSRDYGRQLNVRNPDPN